MKRSCSQARAIIKIGLYEIVIGFFSWFSNTISDSWVTKALIYSRVHFNKFMYIRTLRISSVLDPDLKILRISVISSGEERVNVE